eukprot:s57_g2.t1
MRRYIDEYKKNGAEPFFHRKSGRVVLSLLHVEHEGKAQFVRGINSEVSLPTGSVCAERTAIGNARAFFPNIIREQMKGIAVLEVPLLNNWDADVNHDLLNPLPPCGACNEWLLKIGEKSPGFYVVTFQDLSLDVVHERFLFWSKEESATAKKEMGVTILEILRHDCVTRTVPLHSITFSKSVWSNQASLVAPRLTAVTSYSLRAVRENDGQLRGRTSERGLEQPPVPRDPKMPQPPTSRGLMTRRTFNLPRAESPVPIPEGPPTRAPRAPGDVRPLASTMMRQVPHRPPRPLAATFQEGESTELPRRRHRSTSVTPPGEASASASRAGSEGEGGELCPTRSILRSSNSRERSHQKRVSFSNDCKRAPPASMADLIRTCPDDLDKRETSPSSPSLGDLRCVNAKQDTPHLQLIQRQLLLLKPSLKNRSWDEAKEKAANVVSELNWNELNALLRGEHFAMTGSPDEGYYVGNIRGVSRLGIPALKMQDAAQGFRATQPNTGGTTTAFPCMLALASTWDEDLVALVAAAIATEFKGKGANVILGPSVNVHRGATGGRNFEYLSGEDPHLGFRLTAAYVKAVQELRRRETNRMTMDAKASERTGMELYLAPFRGAVAAGVGAFMCAYNKVNHTYACHNAELLTKAAAGCQQSGEVEVRCWVTTVSKTTISFSSTVILKL